ncbi:17318_t:CDS:2, partial [Racocetra fulgida]
IELVAEAKSLPGQRIVPAAVACKGRPVAYHSSVSRSAKACKARVTYSSSEIAAIFSLSDKDESQDFLHSPSSGAYFSGEISESFEPMSLTYLNVSLSDVIIDSFAPVLPTISVKSKPPKIETLYKFLDFQSFDGSFLISTTFYSWFGKNDFKDFEVIGVENEKVLCLALAIAYLEIIMFETFKDECEMCYGKAKKALKKEVGDDEQKIHEILEKVKEWVKKWADE